ncbi:hypothetical protein [Novosphingobium sp. THN1]|uniref:hypothetical protein n=1 Tax=Novosphingobium sp. THN1 TaxID=1016987 RepID=UPI00196792FD|nr:hypothetical protein [Novosphingobium sp. THN1]
MNRKRSLVLAGLSSLALIQPATIAAKVDRVVVETVTQAEPVAGTPAYEIVSGHFAGTLDPHLPGNAVITDIAQAPAIRRGWWSTAPRSSLPARSTERRQVASCSMTCRTAATS